MLRWVWVTGGVGLLMLPLVGQERKGVTVELAGCKAVTPADWQEEPLPPKSLRMMQFRLPRAQGDSEDAELALFVLRGGGAIDANLKRQEAKFEIPPGTKREEAIQLEKFSFGGKYDAWLQDIRGIYLKKFPPFAPDAKVTRVPDYRQLYVIFEVLENGNPVVYSMTLLGPARTVEKHKKAFVEWVKSFK
ncbi:MAG: hypothetical protein NZ703_12025 [Gemmataceae bacterium]|nr:hypothetical protein [Gemmataceae bacterium]MCS7271797.1 hypothetical protein [Gemmataceae bacterium]MDW8243514.1 hypothetical protein [Thermogemmata sp.]